MRGLDLPLILSDPVDFYIHPRSLTGFIICIHQIDAANRVPYDIDDLTDSDFTQSLSYSPELAAIVSSGGRHKRWGLCLTP